MLLHVLRSFSEGFRREPSPTVTRRKTTELHRSPTSHSTHAWGTEGERREAGHRHTQTPRHAPAAPQAREGVRQAAPRTLTPSCSAALTTKRLQEGRGTGTRDNSSGVSGETENKTNNARGATGHRCPAIPVAQHAHERFSARHRRLSRSSWATARRKSTC